MKNILITIAAVVLVGCGNLDRALIQAIDGGNIKAVKQHLASGADLNAKAEDGWTPLHLAAFERQNKIAELLIASGADVNAKDDDGMTPLHFATSGEIVELLIDANADVNAKDEEGETPLDWANLGPPEITDLLRKHGGKTGDWFKAGESIFTAAKVGHIEAVKQHLTDGTDVNAEFQRIYSSGSEDGSTPLFETARFGHKEVAQLLIASGADVNAKDKAGRIALHIAANWGRKEVAELLITNGTEVNTNDDVGKTPLDWANARRQTETIALLRKHGGTTGDELKAEQK
jgi:ankyrin repeat protein